MQDLIVVKQLPQIEEHLKELSLEVEQKVENAKSLVCTEENVTTIKQIRASLQAPVIEEKQEEILTLRFAVRGTRTKLRELKQFLENGGYDYE